MMNNEVLKCAS